MPNNEIKPIIAGNAYLTRCYHQCKYPTNQRQRQIQQNDSTLGCILKLGIKQQEDNHDTHKRSEHQRTAGRLLAFKLTAIFHMISFGKLDLRINPFLYIIHHAAQITTAGIAEITILRFTFSRLMVFGPMAETTSAT